MSKPGMRARLASLSFSEKISILERLRDRSSAFTLVKVFLVGCPNDPTPDQTEKMRQKLQPEVQKYLTTHLKAGSPNASRSALYALLRHWLVGQGRKVRFELEVDGNVKRKEVTRVEELNALIGQGETPATLLRAIGFCEEAGV
jgi:hypothetical protein